MSKIKLVYIKNVLLVANGLANFIGAVFVNYLFSRVTDPLLPTSIVLNSEKLHIVFTSSAFSFAIIFTLLYERPIRQYLNTLFKHNVLPDEFVTKARRKLLNEPFVLLALDLGIWLTAAIVYPAQIWILGAGAIWIQGSIVNALANGLVTVTLAFFLLEHLLQKRLAPFVFPEGGLYKIPRTLRIRIRMRIAALMIACNLIPLFSILHIIHRISVIQLDAAAALEQLRSAVFTYILIFVSLSFFSSSGKPKSNHPV